MPFFFGMIDMLINKFPGYPFYGYINGDILVENTIKDVLEQVYADILSGKLGPKVSLFTHRKNMFASFPDDLYNNNSESREYFPSFSLSLTSSELFTRFNRRMEQTLVLICKPVPLQLYLHVRPDLLIKKP